MSRLAGARFPALGTSAHVIVTDSDMLGEAEVLTRTELDALDRAASRFREDSELVALNASNGAAVVVSPLLFRAVEEALFASRSTLGVIDPTVGQALELCGYDRDFAEVVPEGPALTARLCPVPGWRRVQIDHPRSTVRVPKGVQVDLGATAKAGCADRTAALVARALGCGVLVNLGGDLAVAGPPPSGGWPVRIADRHDADEDIEGVTVSIAHGGLATSSTTARRWSRGGRVLHHLIDPSTGAPARPYWRTVSVAAQTCLLANIASTTSVILGPEAPEWLSGRGLAARLVHEDGWSVPVGSWPRETARESERVPASC
jgi:thiamine biosynthesis lipoprotein